MQIYKNGVLEKIVMHHVVKKNIRQDFLRKKINARGNEAEAENRSYIMLK